MEDWKTKLAGLNQELTAKEQAVDAAKAAVLAGFRMRLAELEPVLKSAAEFGDAFGAELAWEVSRFEHRYPYLRFHILQPSFTYYAECKDGVITERVEADAPVVVTLDDLSVKRFQERVTRWMEAATNANRKVPGKRK